MYENNCQTYVEQDDMNEKEWFDKILNEIRRDMIK